MAEVNNNRVVLYLQPEGKNVKMDWRYESVSSIWQHYDANNNGVLEQQELKNMKEDYKKAAGSDRVMANSELSKFASKFSMSANDVKQFFHSVDGELIGANIKESLQPRLLGEVDYNKAERLINKVNKQNITKLNYAYTHKTQSNRTLAEDIIRLYPYDKAKTLIQKLVNAAAAACKDNKIDIKAFQVQYNTALKNQDKDAIITSVNNIMDSLEYADINMERNKTYHADKNKNGEFVELGYGNSRILTDLALESGIDPKSKDLVGDGVLGNTKSVALTKEGQVVLNALNTVFKDKTLKNKISSCLRKDNYCLSLVVPNTKRVYTKSENRLVADDVIKDSVVGDGDMSLLVSSVIKEAKKAGKDLTNTESMVAFVKDLFACEENSGIMGQVKSFFNQIF